MFKTGQQITEKNYTAAALWCNQHGARIESQNGVYVIVANTPEPAPSAEENVTHLESTYGLTRAVRTSLLALRAAGVVLDEELMARVDEVEAAAVPLRAKQGESV